MKKKIYELTLLDNDLALISDDIMYATNANGRMFGIQTNITESKEETEKRICEICERMHNDILELSKILEDYGNKNK